MHGESCLELGSGDEPQWTLLLYVTTATHTKESHLLGELSFRVFFLELSSVSLMSFPSTRM